MTTDRLASAEALLAGATRKRASRWFLAGWQARDRRAGSQIDALQDAMKWDINLWRDRCEMARQERDQLRKERDYLVALLKQPTTPVKIASR